MPPWTAGEEASGEPPHRPQTRHRPVPEGREEEEAPGDEAEETGEAGGATGEEEDSGGAEEGEEGVATEDP